MADRTGLEPATSCVTGRRSSQLNYNPTQVANYATFLANLDFFLAAVCFFIIPLLAALSIAL
jgi:hypothetical protein